MILSTGRIIFFERIGVLMTKAFRNALVYTDDGFIKRNVLITDGKISYTDDIESYGDLTDNCIIIPGLIDVHVHLREPGFSYKETIKTGSSAAAHGGYSVVCTMPNLNPVPDSLDNLKEQLDIIERDAVVRVIPYGAVTKGQKGEVLSDIKEMAPYVCAFSDDGRGIQDEKIMEEAMRECAKEGKILAAHCEINSLVRGGYIHDGEYARLHGHKGISSESEYEEVRRDIECAQKTGCRYHVCHMSTKESVELVRSAKAKGIDVTCETAPHYLILTDMDLKEEGRFKMNPPIRSSEDRDALIEGIMDGTIDMIATDHAPHSTEEKSKGLSKSAMGVTGLETAFPVMYTNFVRNGRMSLEKLVELMSLNPEKRFGFDTGDDFTVFETETPYVIDPENFLTKGRATPFEGMTVYGKCIMTVCRGRVVYQEK